MIVTPGGHNFVRFKCLESHSSRNAIANSKVISLRGSLGAVEIKRNKDNTLYTYDVRAGEVGKEEFGGIDKKLIWRTTICEVH